MDFTEVKSKLTCMAFETIRTETDDYFEAVCTKRELPQMTACLDSLFGKSFFPPAVSLPVDIDDVVADFGGVVKGQTLYFTKDGAVCFFAMLWPWQDKEHITLKTGKKL